MKKKVKTNKFNLYQHQGLPIAALALVFLIVFLLIAVNLTNKTEEENNVQGANVRLTQTANNSNSSSIDSLLRDIDAFLRSGNNLNPSDLTDLN